MKIKHVCLENTKVKLLAHNGKLIPAIGVCELETTHKGNILMIQFVIVPGKVVPVIELRACYTFSLIPIIYVVQQQVVSSIDS